MSRPVGTEKGNSMWVLLIQFQDPGFWSWCPARSPRRSRPEDRRKSLSGETGSPAPSSQREDGEPEESVRGASRSDSVGKQVSYSLAGAGGLEAGTVQRQRGAWGRWLEGPGPGGWAPGAPPGPFALPPPPLPPRLRPSPLAGPSRRRPDSPDTRPPPARPRGRPGSTPPAAARPQARLTRAWLSGRRRRFCAPLPAVGRFSPPGFPRVKRTRAAACRFPPAARPLPVSRSRAAATSVGFRLGRRPGSGLERWCPRAARLEGRVLAARVQPLCPGRRPQAAAHHFLQQRVPLFPASGHVLCVLVRFLGTSLVEAGGRSG